MQTDCPLLNVCAEKGLKIWRGSEVMGPPKEPLCPHTIPHGWAFTVLPCLRTCLCFLSYEHSHLVYINKTDNVLSKEEAWESVGVLNTHSTQSLQQKQWKEVRLGISPLKHILSLSQRPRDPRKGKSSAAILPAGAVISQTADTERWGFVFFQMFSIRGQDPTKKGWLPWRNADLQAYLIVINTAEFLTCQTQEKNKETRSM